MLTHSNLTVIVRGDAQVMRMEPNWMAISALSVCYLYERTSDYCYFYRGCNILFTRTLFTIFSLPQRCLTRTCLLLFRGCWTSLAGKMEGLVPVSAGIPQIDGVLELGILVISSYSIGHEGRRLHAASQGLRKGDLARLLFLRKLRSLVGTRFQYCLSGGAPLAPYVAKLLWAAGVVVYEGYGLTEAAPNLAVNRHGFTKIGTVGQCFPGVELRVDNNGEILALRP